MVNVNREDAVGLRVDLVFPLKMYDVRCMMFCKRGIVPVEVGQLGR